MWFGNITIPRGRIVRAAAAVACMATVCGVSFAAHGFGALAVGQTGSVAKDGIAMGTSWDGASAEDANNLALNNCHKWKEKGAPKAAELCRVITVEAGVTAIPVSAFYTENAPTNFIRFCFSKRDEVLDGALERLARWIAEPARA